MQKPSEGESKLVTRRNKTEPASNPETMAMGKIQIDGKAESATPSISKNNSEVTPSSQQILSSEKYQYILMQSQVSRLNKQIEIENQIKRNKELYSKVEAEIKAQEDQIRQKKRLMIQNRILDLEKSKKERKQKEIQSDRTVVKLKLKEKKKQYILQKLLEKNKADHQQCYQKALQDRKMLLQPMNFEEIQMHQKEYLKSRKKCITNFNEEGEFGVERNESKEGSLRYKMDDNRQNRSESKSLSSRKGGSSRNTKRKLEVRSSIQQYLETRKKEEKRIEELRELLQKQKDYGNRVEMQFHKNRAKTESIDYLNKKQRQHAQEKGRMIIERNKVLKNMKKPLIPEYFNKNIEERRKQEIDKIVQSRYSPEEKMLRLNQMSQAQFSQLKVRNRVEDLQRLNQINMMRAELLLNLH